MIQDKCEYCGKEMEGHTDGQVNNMMMVHKMSKHPEQFREEMGR